MNSSVRNAIRILNCFSSERAELRLTEIADHLGMNRSTVHHLIKTLREEGVLEKNEENFYYLGRKMFEWGSMVNFSDRLVPLCNPYIHDLVHQTGEVVHMGILDADKVLYISKSEALSSLKVGTKIGSRQPAHCTALGKMLLAQEGEEVLQWLIDKGFQPKTRETIIEGKKFIQEVKKVRETGLAVDNGEYAKEVYCIAVKVESAVQDYKAAISICGPRNRMEKNRALYARYLTNSALAIEKAADDLNLLRFKRTR